ncbi:MAG: nuclear transport factor 2 family protein [Myxococcales bacterium]|nr:nuclear transport factor 2 family protein [Myxococcales bacterium]
MMSRDEAEVLAANEAFYAIFASRDLTAMEQLWARNLGITCIHPGWSPLQSRASVIGSLRGILDNPTSPKIRCVEPRVHLLGETAYVICFEVFSGSRLVATNVFAREDGEWRMVHHQAGPVATSDEAEEEEAVDPGALN